MRVPKQLRVALGVTVLVALALVRVDAIASADVGLNVTTTPIIVPSDAANTSVIQNDEPIQFNVPAGELPDSAHVHVIECSDPGGNITAAFLGTLTANSCDALTEVSYVTNPDGSLTTSDPTDPTDAPGSIVSGNGAVVVYSLPNLPDLFETASAATCDSTDYCIFYIGANPETPSDGTDVVYSQPFEVDQSYDYLLGNPAPPPGTTESVPGAPTDVTTTAGPGQVVVGWTAPTSDGNSAITEYVITPYLNGVAQTAYQALPTASSDTVIDLTPGDEYTFTVEAVNAVGTSPPANSATVTPLPVVTTTTTTTTTTVPVTTTTVPVTTTTVPVTTTTLPVTTTVPSSTPAAATTSTTTTTTTTVAPTSTSTVTTTTAPSSSAGVTTTTLAPIKVSALGTVALAGRISTEISCGSVQCSGTVQLYAPGVAGKSTKASGHRPRAKYPSVGEKSPAMVLLGSAKYSLSPGSDKAIVLRLTPLGKHWLATARTHSPRAELKVIPTGGTASTTQIVVY